MLTGLCLVAGSTAMAQNSGSAVFSNIGITPLNPAGSAVGSINSAIILPHVFNDAPASIGTYNNSYPGSILLSEANVQTQPAPASKEMSGISPTTAEQARTSSLPVTTSPLPSV